MWQSTASSIRWKWTENTRQALGMTAGWGDGKPIMRKMDDVFPGSCSASSLGTAWAMGRMVRRSFICCAFSPVIIGGLVLTKHVVSKRWPWRA